jgi:hypothetical protein
MENIPVTTESHISPVEDFERKISKKIHEFDLFSLLKLLMYHGFLLEEIHFKSHMSTCSQPGLIQGIEFLYQPERQVVITINMGLLSAQSALPSYFQKNVDTKDIDSISFGDFIGYFDHFLIRNYIFNIYPEKNIKYFSDWEITKRQYLQIMDLKSSSTLFWIFQLVFPELKIQVKKMVMERGLQASALIMGKTILGSDAVFGKKTEATVYGMHITLFSDEEFTDTRIPWPKEIKSRLDDQVFPILRSAEVDVEIILVIQSQKRWMKLESESYLGYDKMKGGKAQARRIRIFRGHLRDV